MFCIYGFVENLVILHQVALMRDAGFSTAFVSSIIVLWGVVIAVGSLAGFLSDKIGREKTFTIGCLAAVLGLGMLLVLEQNHGIWIPYVYAIFFGLGLGITGPALGSALADVFQGRYFGSINGFMGLGFGLGGIIGPWLGGFAFDATGSYSGVLIVAILVTCTACGLLWAAAPRKIRRPG